LQEPEDEFERGNSINAEKLKLEIGDNFSGAQFVGRKLS